MTLRFYSPMSTANPTGVRPWNSRLSFYIPNSYAVPTTGRGRYLLQPGIVGQPAANGGLSGPQFPNYAGFQRSRQSHRRYASSAPRPIYGPPPSMRSQLSGLGVMPVSPVMRARPPIRGTTLATGYGPTSFGAGRFTAPSSGLTQPVNSSIVGYNAAGGAIYSQPQPGSYYRNQLSQAAMQPTSAYAPGTSTGYDAAGNPIYAGGPPAGMYQVGTDAYGNPTYSNQPTSAAAAPVQAAAAATTSSTASDFFSEDSLGLGLNNGWYAAIGGGLVFLMMMKGRR
jgi:hypothetical protein